MSKAVVFKQPTVRPNADDWVEKRATPVAAGDGIIEQSVAAPAVTMSVAPEDAPPLPVSVSTTGVALAKLPVEKPVQGTASGAGSPEPVSGQVVSAETVALPSVPAPRVLLERATTRMSVSIDETVHMRLKILCARGRFKIGEFMAKAIEDAVVKAEQEAAA